MSNFNRGMRLGAGLVTLGYGAYRLSQGRRDFVTTASLTTGASMVLADMNVGPIRGAGGGWNTAANVARIAMRALT